MRQHNGLSKLCSTATTIKSLISNHKIMIELEKKNTKLLRKLYRNRKKLSKALAYITNLGSI